MSVLDFKDRWNAKIELDRVEKERARRIKSAMFWHKVGGVLGHLLGIILFGFLLVGGGLIALGLFL